MELITIKAFRAPHDREMCELYIREHRKVLEDFGVSNVVRSDQTWTTDQDCIVIVAVHHELGLVGGIRIERAGPNKRIPLENSISTMDPTIHEVISKYTDNGCAEICGLWNANNYSGRGIPLLLSMAAVSISQRVGLGSLTCFVAHYTLRHALKVGFQIMEHIGDGGAFNYPVPSIKSFAMLIPNTVLLEGAHLTYRERILSLRCRPVQERIESPSGVPYPVRYQLHMDASSRDLDLYGSIASEYLRQCA